MDIDQYIKASLEGLRMQMAAHEATWGIGSARSWDVNQNDESIIWKFSDGRVVKAPVQIVGTLNPDDGSFLWAWDNPSVQMSLSGAAQLVKDFGLKHGLAEFATAKVTAGEKRAWEFTALACRLASANGAYRGLSGGPAVFMTFGELNISKRD